MENLRLAQETFDLAEERFRHGATDNRELIEAQQGLDQAETDLLDLKLFRLLASLRFAHARGSVESFADQPIAVAGNTSPGHGQDKHGQSTG